MLPINLLAYLHTQALNADSLEFPRFGGQGLIRHGWVRLLP